MNWDAVGAVAELLGAIAVIATLAYLALQVKHATSVARAVARQTAAQLNIDTIGSSLDSQILSSASRKATAGEELSSDELSNYLRWVWMRMRVVENTFYHYQEGLIEVDYWESHKQYIVAHLGPDSVARVHWSRVASAYTENFVDEVEQVLDTHALSAKAP